MKNFYFVVAVPKTCLGTRQSSVVVSEAYTTELGAKRIMDKLRPLNDYSYTIGYQPNTKSGFKIFNSMPRKLHASIG